MSILFDLVCYLALLALMIYMTRVRANRMVKLEVDGEKLTGKIIFASLVSQVGLDY